MNYGGPPFKPLFFIVPQSLKHASIITTLNMFEKGTEQNDQSKSNIKIDHPGGSFG